MLSSAILKTSLCVDSWCRPVAKITDFDVDFCIHQSRTTIHFICNVMSVKLFMSECVVSDTLTLLNSV